MFTFFYSLLYLTSYWHFVSSENGDGDNYVLHTGSIVARQHTSLGKPICAVVLISRNCCLCDCPAESSAFRSSGAHAAVALGRRI